MSRKINIYLIEYAINSIIRQKYKNIFISIVLTLLVFLLSSVFFITSSLKHELISTLEVLPQIIVQKMKAGRHYDIDTESVDNILTIHGVEDANARVWGYYFFENAGVNFSLVGVEEFESAYKNSLKNIVNNHNEIVFNEKSSMIVGSGVQKILHQNYYEEYFNFIKTDGSIKKIYLTGVFDADTQLESNDMIVMSKENLREIFDMPEGKATDIVVKVANTDEIDMVSLKIKQMYPDTRVISKKDIEVSYQNIFDYKGGVFLALFIVSIFTFFIIVYDKASGLSSEEKKEIGILKAVGWKVDDVLKEKFYEGFIISFFAYSIGITLAFFFVYVLQAPLLQDVFVGYSELKTSFELPFVFDVQTLFLVFFLSVPIYIGATVIPSWKAATLEADEVMR